MIFIIYTKFSESFAMFTLVQTHFFAFVRLPPVPQINNIIFIHSRYYDKLCLKAQRV